MEGFAPQLPHEPESIGGGKTRRSRQRLATCGGWNSGWIKALPGVPFRLKEGEGLAEALVDEESEGVAEGEAPGAAVIEKALPGLKEKRVKMMTAKKKTFLRKALLL